jgi:hypothetical protein
MQKVETFYSMGGGMEHISSIKQDVVASVNSLSKLSPTVCLTYKEIFTDGKFYTLLCWKKFSQVHRHATKIFIRNDCTG